MQHEDDEELAAKPEEEWELSDEQFNAQRDYKRNKSVATILREEMGKAYEIICRPGTFHSQYREIYDGVPKHLYDFLNYLINESCKFRAHKARKGWFYKTERDITADLRISRQQQTKNIAELRKMMILKVKHIPMQGSKNKRRVFQIDYAAIGRLIIAGQVEKEERERERKAKKVKKETQASPKILKIGKTTRKKGFPTMTRPRVIHDSPTSHP